MHRILSTRLRTSQRRSIFPSRLLCLVTVALLTITPTVWADDDPGPLVPVSGGSPFLDCTADQVGNQPGVLFNGAEVEPWVAVNPTDPDNMVAAWQQDRWSNGSARGIGVAVSHDGGESWATSPLPGLTPCTGGAFIRATDPWLSFAQDGTLFHMALVTDGRIGRSAMVIQKSTDGGSTWSAPLSLVDDVFPLFNDKNSVTVDPTDSRFVYTTWDRLDFANGGGPALLARSTDGGDTFEPPSVIWDPGPNGQTIGNQIFVLPNGTVVSMFNDVAFLPGPPFFQLTVSAKYSLDKGQTWLPEGPPIGIAVIQSTFSVAEPQTGVLVRDSDIGFEAAVDPVSGQLYAVWQDARFNGGLYDTVGLSTSTDGGLTWSDPVRINQTPEVGGVLLRQSFVPSVDVNDNGRVAITYYDFRNDGAEPEALTDHWAITCNARPGGKTRDCGDPSNWSGEIRLTDESFDILAAPLTGGGLFLGDYVGLANARNEFVSVFVVSSADDPSNLVSRIFDEGPEVDEDEDKSLVAEPLRLGRKDRAEMRERQKRGLARVMQRLHRPEVLEEP